jgi:hypothetical protein
LFRALLLDFNDDSKADKKPKKKTTKFFDEENSDDERGNQGIIDSDDDGDSDIDMEITWQPGLKSKAEEKLQTFNNPKEKKTNKNKKHEKANLLNAQDDDEEEEDSTENHRETLELLTVDDEIDAKRDYNLRDMIKSHKQTTKAAAKNAKKTKKQQLSSSVETKEKTNNDSFQLNVNDKRFQAVYTKSVFNIDQTDPHFKSTAGTQQLIDEKLKKRKLDNITSSSRTERDEDDIVIKLKRKSAKND